jgi:hypothetical protein
VASPENASVSESWPESDPMLLVRSLHNLALNLHGSHGSNVVREKKCRNPNHFTRMPKSFQQQGQSRVSNGGIQILQSQL